MSEIGNGHVRIERDGRRADVIIARPEKRNAMNEATVADLTAAIEEVDADNDVRAATLLGEGSVFCAGFQPRDDAREGRGRPRRVPQRVPRAAGHDRRDDDPVVAGIKGAGIAGGFELTLPADLRVLGEEAKYGIIEVNLGIFPHQGSTQRLPRIVGLGKAKELVLTGDYIDPEEAAQCNPVTEVVPGENVDDRARELADELTEKALLGIQNALEAFQATFDVPLEDGLSTEHRLAMQVYGTRDRKEGFEAQLEGRDAEFEGR